MPILIAIAVLVVIAIICAVLLTLSDIFFGVKEDERVAAVRDCLPGANCGACGFSGCDGYAKALAEGMTDNPSLCVPGGDGVAAEIGEIMVLRQVMWLNRLLTLLVTAPAFPLRESLFTMVSRPVLQLILCMPVIAIVLLPALAMAIVQRFVPETLLLSIPKSASQKSIPESVLVVVSAQRLVLIISST